MRFHLEVLWITHDGHIECCRRGKSPDCGRELFSSPAGGAGEAVAAQLPLLHPPVQTQTNLVGRLTRRAALQLYDQTGQKNVPRFDVCTMLVPVHL